MSERMLDELGLELTTPELTARVANDSATEARLKTKVTIALLLDGYLQSLSVHPDGKFTLV